MDGDGKQGFGLIVQRLGQDHLSAVGELNLEVLCIRLQNTHRDINNDAVIVCLSFFRSIKEQNSLMSGQWSKRSCRYLRLWPGQ